MAETEKIMINMGTVDLGKIDFLVEQGHYSNRADFIRTAISSQLEKHTLEVQQTVARHSHVIGMLVYARVDFEKYKARGEKINVSIVGMFMITSDTSADLVGEVIESITVYGIFQVSDAVRAVLTESGKLK